MSSIIVLDSSDEDESTPKKANVKSTSDSGSVSTNPTSSVAKNQAIKQRSIPTGITITPRISPTSPGSKSVNMQSLNAPSMTASFLAFNSINDERHTPTPPKAPQMGNLNSRKRKTPTPPKTMPQLAAQNYGTVTNASPAKAATTVAPLPPIMPMITGVHSMTTAGATPPLQLMATPPHNLGAFMGLNEQLMINPHLLPTGLPPNTTITAHTHPNQNNINNNFKIHLPFNKPTISPAASPASLTPKTSSPQLTLSPQHGRGDKSAGRRIKPTTLLKSSDESWQRQKQFTQNDKLNQRIPVSLKNDVIEMLPPTSTDSPKSISTCSSRYNTPMTSPTTPKSQKSPDVIMLKTPTDNTQSLQKDFETVLDLTHSPDKVKEAHFQSTEIVDLVNIPDKQKKQVNGQANSEKTEKKPEKPPPRPPLEPEYEELIKVCREADSSKDMEKLIKSKLLKYYYEVHNDFVKSKSFRKSIRKVVDAIKAKPDLVYYNLKTIVEELNVRRKARLVEEVSATNNGTTTATNNPESELNSKENPVKNTTTSDSSVPTTSTTTSYTSEISATASTSTGNKKLDEQIKKLNKALYVLTKRIEVLEQTEVDWDDDDSSFLQVERFKKRACQIYEKICDLTGESKNAHRLVKKPIKFNETRIPQFNKTLQAFINRTKEFPDYYDVLRMLEHCNRTYSLGLVNFEMKNIAEDAFIKVGKLLQSRRKADLYETVTHYAGDGADPAKTDPALAAKLNENFKNHKRINEILEKFARKQDTPDEEEEEKAEKTSEYIKETTETIAEADSEMEKDTKNKIIKDLECREYNIPILIKAENSETTETAGQVQIKPINDVYEDDDDEDDDEEEEDDENLDEQVETLANGDISDNESENEIMITECNINDVKDSRKKDERIMVSLNNDILEIVDTIPQKRKTPSYDNMSEKCIDIFPQNSKNDNIMQVCMKKKSESIERTSNLETHNLIMQNKNNNNDVDTTLHSKTVIKQNSTKECSLRSPPPTTLSYISPASIKPTRNGKLKDTYSALSYQHHLLKNEIATATITSTTSTADLKIVHVSSLEPDRNNSSTSKELVVGSNLSTDLTATSANKTLEEIIISDEES